MARKKRKLEEWDVSAVEESTGASVHGGMVCDAAIACVEQTQLEHAGENERWS